MSNLSLRILSAVFLIPLVLILIFYSGEIFFLFFISFLSSLAGFEFSSFTLNPSMKSRSYSVAFLSFLICSSISFSNFFPWAPLVVLPSSVILSFLFFIFGNGDLSDATRSFSFATSGSFYCGSLIGFIGLLFSSHDTGPFWVFTLVCSAFMGDTFSFIFGKLFGRRKLYFRLSPGKTWAGAFGGFLGTILSLVFCKIFLLNELSFFDSIFLSFPLSLSFQLGDLSESFLKRGLGIKDSGRLIPGHGGLLDRIDALMFGAPVIFFYSVLL